MIQLGDNLHEHCQSPWHRILGETDANQRNIERPQSTQMLGRLHDRLEYKKLYMANSSYMSVCCLHRLEVVPMLPVAVNNAITEYQNGWCCYLVGKNIFH